MVLVDTSCWIEALRERGREDVRQRVAELLLDGEAAWCEIVRMELLQGVRAGREAKELRKLEESVQMISTDAKAWTIAGDLTVRARDAGLNVPVTDLIIAGTAVRHGVELEHLDKHLAALMKLK